MNGEVAAITKTTIERIARISEQKSELEIIDDEGMEMLKKIIG